MDPLMTPGRLNGQMMRVKMRTPSGAGDRGRVLKHLVDGLQTHCENDDLDGQHDLDEPDDDPGLVEHQPQRLFDQPGIQEHVVEEAPRRQEDEPSIGPDDQVGEQRGDGHDHHRAAHEARLARNEHGQGIAECQAQDGDVGADPQRVGQHAECVVVANQPGVVLQRERIVEDPGFEIERDADAQEEPHRHDEEHDKDRTEKDDVPCPDARARPDSLSEGRVRCRQGSAHADDRNDLLVSTSGSARRASC